MFKINELSKNYGGKKIFDNLSLSGFSESDKIGVIGENGRGKSTLLKIIGKEILPDSGNIEYSLKNPLIGYMPQELSLNFFNDSETIINYLEKVTGNKELGLRIDKIYEEMGSGSYNDSLLEELGEIQEQYEKLGGYEFESIVDKVLDGLKVEGISKKSKLVNLSGGQKSKILLAGTLLTGGDILLLDEPTNNLDIKSIEWLIEYVKSKLVTTLIVSHDKNFLNEITNKTLELGMNGAKVFSGNYDFYKKEKEVLLNRENINYLNYQEKLKELQEKLNSLQSKKSSTSKVKRGSDNNKKASNKARENAQNSSGSEVKKLKQEIEVLVKNKPEFNKASKGLKFNLNVNEKVNGGIDMENIKFRYPESEVGLDIEKFSVKDGEKVIILGNNGVGKSTLIKLINGDLEAQNGEIKKSPSIIIGNYLQEHQVLESDKTVFEFLNNSLENKNVTDINSILARFNFNIEDRNKKIGILSPGQRSRMLLALFTLKKCNTLIFDEPTNHLDLEGVEELENALKEFNGNLIVISHDKDFVHNIGFDSVYNIAKGNLSKMDSIEEYFNK